MSVALEDGSKCVFCLAQSLVVWLFKFCCSVVISSFVALLALCLNVVRNSPKTKVLCAEYSAEIGDLWSLEEWLELLADLSRVWDWKVDCVRYQVRRQAENISKSAAERGLYEEMLHRQDGWFPWWQGSFSLVFWRRSTLQQKISDFSNWDVIALPCT